MSFLQALDLYRTGTLSADQLVHEVRRQIETSTLNVTSTWAELEVAHARDPLPDSVHSALVRLMLQRRVGVTPAERPSTNAYLAASNEDDTFSATVDATRPITQTIASSSQPKRRKAAIALGTVLRRRFRLVERIGEGGMSTVYKAIDLRKVEARAPDTHVAVKILSVPASDFAHSLESLQAEALTLQKLPHPNIVRVIDCDRDGRTVFMTMEYLSGESLKRKMIARDFKAMPTRDAIRIIESTANGLAFAHRNGIVHGDLKPGNIHITNEGDVKIIDFGIARLMTRDPGATIAGDERPKLSALTPPYASPEMLESGNPDPRDDIYALACIAHELLTGRHPFDRMVANEARDSGLKLTRSKLLSPGQYRAIAHGLEFERAKRTPTVEGFLAEFTASSGVRSGPHGVIVGTVIIGAVLAAYLGAHEQIFSWIKAHRLAGTAPPIQNELFRDCATCPLMKLLPPGHFTQGVPENAADTTQFDRPQHPVAIEYPLGMSVYEVTVGEFREFASTRVPAITGCTAYDGAWKLRPELNWDNVGFSQTTAHPVVCVSWQDASDYARWLTQKTGHRYRMPSESEWEYAARAGSGAPRPWIDSGDTACTSANIADQTAAQRYPGWNVEPCSDGYVYTAPVGSFKPNAFGLYDMLGNALEWVQDCWQPNYQGAPSDGSAWVSGSCSEHDLRGGSWFTSPSSVSTTGRSRFDRDYRSNSIGFRLVREIKP